MTRSDRQHDIAVYQPGPLYHPMDGYQQPSEQEPSSESLFSMIDDRLRGRWKFMFIAGTLASLALVALAFTSVNPSYRSTGAIRVSPRIDTLLVKTPEGEGLPAFSRYVETQVQFIQSRRVIEHAARASELKPFNLGSENAAIALMEDSLTVKSDRSSELIFIAFDSPDPKLAQAACNAVIDAYYDLFGDAGSDQIGSKITQLKDHRDQVTRELRQNQNEEQRLISKYPTTDLENLQAGMVEAISLIEDDLASFKSQLALLEGETEGADSAALSDPGEMQLIQINPRLGQLAQMRDEAQTRFDFVKQRHRAGSSQYIRAEKAAETSQLLYEEEYAKTLVQWQEIAQEVPIGELIQNGSLRGIPADRLRSEIESLELQLEQERQTARTLMSDIQRKNDLLFARGQIEAELTQTDTRIRDLDVEEDALRKGRISIAQEGFLPTRPYSDSRKKRVIAAGALGYMLSFGVFFLLGSIDKRAYGSRQLRTGAGALSGCLGVLPDLGRSLRDPESSDVAAHCVHQIRNQIEAVRQDGEGYVLAISSPHQGDGKTSIVMALGWSYAAAGYNTLLVDCDLVGRSLTRQLGMVGRKGLKEALRSHELNGELAQLHVEHLSVLPVGADARFGPETIRKLDLQKIFDSVRDRYDVIIVDTGPMLGSLESTPVTAAADGVVLSVRRGRSRTRLDECVTRLATVGARYLGVILNCATRNDCDRYVSEASLAAIEGDASEAGTQTLIHTSQGEQNALMVAMETTTRRSSDDDEEA